MRSPKRVLWISRHTMTAAQRADLERVMGGAVELTPWTDTVEDRALAAAPDCARGRDGGGAAAGKAGRADRAGGGDPGTRGARRPRPHRAHGGPARRAAGEGVRLRASRLAADPGGHHPRTGDVTPPPPRAPRRAGRKPRPKTPKKLLPRPEFSPSRADV